LTGSEFDDGQSHGHLDHTLLALVLQGLQLSLVGPWLGARL